MNKLIKDRIQKQLLNFNQEIEFNKTNNVQKTIDDSIEREKWIIDNTVDLGLPSMTRWMKYNIGATSGDTAESWAGKYYAWGELESKTNYKEDTYTYKDNPDIIPLDYDAAYQKTNGICHMPSKEQLEELINETKNKWIENYKGINNLSGRVFTGQNGNSLFIPAAGYYDGFIIYHQGNICYLWSNSIHQSYASYTYILCFYSSGILVDYNARYMGQPIRGVL